VAPGTAAASSHWPGGVNEGSEENLLLTPSYGQSTCLNLGSEERFLLTPFWRLTPERKPRGQKKAFF